MADEQTLAGYSKLYADIMTEIKLRHQAVTDMLQPGKIVPVAPFARAELCFLQLRMMCELVALGCLVAHGDIAATRAGKLKAAWNADLIVSALGKLHPGFYPEPGTQLRKADGQIEVVPITSGFLTKQELSRLYAQTGRVLHRGSVNDLTTRVLPGPEEISAWLNKFSTLLSHHQIQVIDPDFQIWCLMQAEDGLVHTSVMRLIAVSDKDGS